MSALFFPFVVAAFGRTPAHAGSTLVIAHTNDLHAHFLPERAEWIDGTPELGGWVAIEANLRALREEHGAGNVLYLDGGDLLTGTPLMEFERHGALGGMMTDFLERARADAWVVGNHEFDEGWGNAEALVASSDVPVLAANLRGMEGVADHVILEAGGIRVGVFGLITPELRRLVSPDVYSRIELRDLVEVAKAQVAELDPVTDLVVALTHTGVEVDRMLASEVPGLDLIVGGHSHTPILVPEHVADTWIVQAGSYGRVLGKVELTVENDAIARLDGTLVELWPDKLPADADACLKRTVARYQRKIDRKFSETVGTATADMARLGDGDTPLGRWSSDAVRLATASDIGIVNSGGIRADLVAGALDVGDLYEVFPFHNRLVRFEITGEELIGVLLKEAADEVRGGRGRIQLSGVRFEWRVTREVPELVAVTVGGAPLDLARTYTVGTSNYITTQWEHHLGVEPRSVTTLDRTPLDAAIAHARRAPVAPPPDARSVRLEQPPG